MKKLNQHALQGEVNYLYDELVALDCWIKNQEIPTKILDELIIKFADIIDTHKSVIKLANRE